MIRVTRRSLRVARVSMGAGREVRGESPTVMLPGDEDVQRFRGSKSTPVPVAGNAVLPATASACRNDARRVKRPGGEEIWALTGQATRHVSYGPLALLSKLYRQ